MVSKSGFQILMLAVMAAPTAWAETVESTAFDHELWNRLLTVHLLPGADIEYLDYDWRPNKN